ncbi:MAG TPA: hypothetical protein VEW68_01450, partial [Patescibacteria group bacterium]|nr:hypothetical protein [Patescibacteria group bacterium]
LATLVDQSGAPSGLEVDLNGTQPVLASGPLPVALDSAPYPIISTEQAIRLALASSPSPPAGASPTQPVALTEVALVYVLVPAGDHSFYEPAYLFSGTYQAGGTTQVKRVLVPAVDPTQRN